MDKRLSFALKWYGFESSSISFFSSFFFNLLVWSSLFLILCRHGYIYFNRAYAKVNSTNTHVETWIIAISWNVITLCTLDDFNIFVVICWLFFKFTFSKHLSGTLSECQTVFIQTRANVLSVLIGEQSVCKGYKRTTKIVADTKRVRKPRKYWNLKRLNITKRCKVHHEMA